MTIASASVLKDGTVATTGGTATSFLTRGADLVKHSVLIDDSSEFLSQSVVEFSIKEPKVLATAPNGYTQARCTVLLKVPLALDNLAYTMNTIQIAISSDMEMSDAERLTMRVYAAQLLHDTDFLAFWDNQSLA
jgi:hypothetical protein